MCLNVCNSFIDYANFVKINDKTKSIISLLNCKFNRALIISSVDIAHSQTDRYNYMTH